MAARHDEGLTADQVATRAGIEGRDRHFAVLRACAAIAGYELMIIATGNGTSAFLMSRWERTVDLLDVAAVERFLEQAGAR
jgi:hypothetical protein